MANQIPLVVADFETQLSGAISAGDTSLTLASATDDDGNALAAGKYCFTVNNGASNKQYLIGQLNGTAVTSVVYVDRRGNETSGAQYAARSGSPVVITNFASLQRVADILRGQENLDGDNPVTYDAEPTLSNREELATVGYVLDQVNGGTVDFDNQIISSSDATAGETIAAGDLVFFQTSDQEWYQVDADTAAEVNGVQLGIALGAGTDGASITGGVQISGVYTTTGLTAGDTYYASNTAGAISNSAGTTERAIGFALSTTKLLLNFSEMRLPIAGEKDALAGSSGTPSSSNTYVTTDDVSNSGGTGKIIRADGTGLPILLTQATKGIAISSSSTEIADNSTVETNIFSHSIPANALGTTNGLRFKVYVQNFSTSSASSSDPVFRLKYGSTTLATITLDNAAGAVSDYKGHIEGVLIADSSTSAQRGTMELFLAKNDVNTDNGAIATSVFSLQTGTAAEDSTGALNLILSIQWGDASATNDFVPAGYTVELIS